MEFKKNIHYSQELESAILGQCLIEKLAFGRTFGLVDADTFYGTGNNEVYKAMQEMYEISLPIDLLTVHNYLAVNKGIELIQNFEIDYYLAKLTNFVVSTTHIEYHCHLIKQMWQRRKLMELRHQKEDIDAGRALYDLTEALNRITSTEFKSDWYDMSELMYNLMLHQSEMAKGEKTFVTTSFNRLDQNNGGFYNGQMIVIGARPSVGKSALMGQMALSMARQNKKVGIISLEMNNNEIAARLSSIETDIDFSTVFRTIANDEILHKHFYEKVSKDFINLPIYLSDKSKVNVNEIRAKAMKLKATKGCDVIMVDYLQLIESSTSNKNYNREQEVAKMSRGLKLMAQELDIPIIVLCQLNRSVTSRTYKDRFPKLSDLRESGAIEQDADVVIFLHRDYMSGWQIDDNGNSTEYKADLLVPKWRNGATCHLDLEFEPTKMKFRELSTTNFLPVVGNTF